LSALCCYYPSRSFAGDGGPATSALLNRPAGVCPDGAGNLYIADSYNFVVRLITSAGVISTVVGTLGVASFAGAWVCPQCIGCIPPARNSFARALGDGGPASSASLVNPLTVHVESPLGGLFVSHPRHPSAIILACMRGYASSQIAGQDNRIRYVSPLGLISTVAGNGGGGLSGDNGPATAASLANPSLGGDDGLGGWLISDANTNVVSRMAAWGAAVQGPFALWCRSSLSVLCRSGGWHS